MALDQVEDLDSVNKFVDQVRAAFGAEVPLQFTDITFAGETPTTDTNITFQLLIKESKGDADSAAIVDDAAPTVTTAPLVVGFDVDTQSGAGVGFSEGKTFPGELWLVDTVFGTFLVKEFQLKLSDPIKSTFP